MLRLLERHLSFLLEPVVAAVNHVGAGALEARERPGVALRLGLSDFGVDAPGLFRARSSRIRSRSGDGERYGGRKNRGGHDVREPIGAHAQVSPASLRTDKLYGSRPQVATSP